MFPTRPPVDQRRLSSPSATPTPAKTAADEKTAPLQAFEPANELLPKRRVSAADAAGQARQAPIRPRSADPFERLPKEIVELILDHVPNDAGNRLTSLWKTSKSNHYKTFEKTRAKVKASNLIDRASAISQMTAGEDAGFSEFFVRRLEAFRVILEDALDEEIPLRGKDLIDVFMALAKTLSNLGPDDRQGHEIMLGVLEKLGTSYCEVKHGDPEDRKREQIWLDSTKYRLVKSLGSFTPWNAARLDIGQIFDRLHDVTESIVSVEIKNILVGDMFLEEMYRKWPVEIGAKRFEKLLRFAEDNAGNISDISKLKAIKKLGADLYIQDQVEDSDVVEDYGRLCRLAWSIDGEDTRQEACRSLIVMLDQLSLEDQDSAAQLLDGLISTARSTRSFGAETAQPTRL